MIDVCGLHCSFEKGELNLVQKVRVSDLWIASVTWSAWQHVSVSEGLSVRFVERDYPSFTSSPPTTRIYKLTENFWMLLFVYLPLALPPFPPFPAPPSPVVVFVP